MFFSTLYYLGAHRRNSCRTRGRTVQGNSSGEGGCSGENRYERSGGTICIVLVLDLEKYQD